MTTIPTLLDNVPVDAVRRRAEAHPIDWRRVGLAVLAFVPLVLGRAVGYLAWGASYAVAAFMVGYDAGRARPAPAAETTTRRRPAAAVVPTHRGE